MALGAVLGAVEAADPGWQGNFHFRAPIAAVLIFVSWRFLHLVETQKIHEEKASNAITATLNLY
jgi:hypothetical protein